MNAATDRPVARSYYHVLVNAATDRPVDRSYYHVRINAAKHSRPSGSVMLSCMNECSYTQLVQ